MAAAARADVATQRGRYFGHVGGSGDFPMVSMHIPVHPAEQAGMFKKIAIGILAVVIVCGVARSGYAFGKYLAQKDNARSGSVATRAPNAG